MKLSSSFTLLMFLMALLAVSLVGCGSRMEAINDNQTQALTEESPYYEPSDDSTPAENVMTGPTAAASPTENPLFTEISALRGVNLGNALDAPAPGAWGVTITQELILAVQQAGFNAIRLPVRFSAHTGPGPEYTLDPDFLAMVDQVIGWGLDAGLTVLLDLHHFETLNLDPKTARDAFLTVWAQLADRYKNYPERLYFELLNEPADALDPVTWNDLLGEGLAVIRKTNPERVVVVSTANFAAVDALDSLRLPEDDHLAATFHYYEPFELTHQGAGWVPGANAWLGTAWEGTAAQQAAISAAFNNASGWSAAHNIPLILGEFGIIKHADPDSRARWTGFVAQVAEEHGIGWFYWELCADFGIYDCQASVWDPALRSALLD